MDIPLKEGGGSRFYLVNPLSLQSFLQNSYVFSYQIAHQMENL